MRVPICCMVTLFYPDDEQIESVLRYTRCFDKVYLFDNTPSDDCNVLKKYPQDEKVVFLGDGENKGLSFAYNTVCNIASNEGFKFICLLDQDSSFKFEQIKKVTDYINYNDCSKLGIIAPTVKYSHKEKIDTSCSWVISSGSFINLDVYSLSNGFDEKLFIDRIDFDYSMQVVELGFNIKVVEDSYLEQELGQQNKVIGFKFFEHSPLRVYYMFRNRCYYYLTKKRNFKNFTICLLMSIKQLVRICLIESDKLNKIKMAFLGVFDYFRSKYGAFEKK